MAVGWSWRVLHLEQSFHEGRGWWAWGALLLAATFLCVPRGASEGTARDTLPSRLGRTPGADPWRAFALAAGVFAIDALWMGSAALALVAAGSCAVLAAAYLRSRARTVPVRVASPVPLAAAPSSTGTAS
jgi:hypothetical protein